MVKRILLAMGVVIVAVLAFLAGQLTKPVPEAGTTTIIAQPQTAATAVAATTQTSGGNSGKFRIVNGKVDGGVPGGYSFKVTEKYGFQAQNDGKGGGE